MKKKLILALLFSTAFGLGFAFNKLLSSAGASDKKMKKVTGIGGIFFKTKDVKKTQEWYEKHLGLAKGAYGTNIEWRHADDSSKKGFTLWAPFSEKTKYFYPSPKDYMINYRVADLEWLVEELKKEGVTIVDKIETVDYGKFVHILDLEGVKIELWEPNDIVYEKMGN